MLVLDRYTDKIEHHHFYDLPNLIGSNAVIVRNNTKVIPARIYGQKETGGLVEIILIKKHQTSHKSEQWECLTRPGLKEGQISSLGNGLLTGKVEKKDGYTSIISFNKSGHAFFEAVMEIGKTPVPPYIDLPDTISEAELRERYQTIYAQQQGSAAAPTAGLHFTDKVDTELNNNGVQIIELTLHVGLGTFLRVKSPTIAGHHMHSESFELSESAATAINTAKLAGKKIIAVGTTTTRVLETLADENGHVHPATGETDIFLYPPYRFKCVDGLITNYHESESTLLMLVSAFVSAPNTNHEFTTFAASAVGKAYQRALEENYRFLSFGDCMLIR